MTDFKTSDYQLNIIAKILHILTFAVPVIFSLMAFAANESKIYIPEKILANIETINELHSLGVFSTVDNWNLKSEMADVAWWVSEADIESVRYAMSLFSHIHYQTIVEQYEQNIKQAPYDLTSEARNAIYRFFAFSQLSTFNFQSKPEERVLKVLARELRTLKIQKMPTQQEHVDFISQVLFKNSTSRTTTLHSLSSLYYANTDWTYQELDRPAIEHLLKYTIIIAPIIGALASGTIVYQLDGTAFSQAFVGITTMSTLLSFGFAAAMSNVTESVNYFFSKESSNYNKAKDFVKSIYQSLDRQHKSTAKLNCESIFI